MPAPVNKAPLDIDNPAAWQKYQHRWGFETRAYRHSEVCTRQTGEGAVKVTPGDFEVVICKGHFIVQKAEFEKDFTSIAE